MRPDRVEIQTEGRVPSTPTGRRTGSAGRRTHVFKEGK